jgi:hypothetical protein
LAIDEDTLADTERLHTTEPAAYIVFGTALPPPPDPSPRVMAVGGVSSTEWTTVSLDRSYASMVAVCTPNYSASSPPLVVRMRNASGSSFEVLAQRADNSTAPVAGITVHCMVVEEGVFSVAEHGVKMEAVKYLSTVTDSSASWAGEFRPYANSYANPVVLGQVMTQNDVRFSSFWCRGAAETAPPSPTVLRVGKHAGEDPVRARANETIGYVVIESGAGTIEGINYSAAVGPASIGGIEATPPYTYPVSGLSTASVAVATQAGMAGWNGGWTLLYGPNPVSPTLLQLAIDEDQINDSERAHTTESVGYVVFQ